MRRLRVGFSTISVVGTFRVTQALLVNEPYVVCAPDAQTVESRTKHSKLEFDPTIAAMTTRRASEADILALKHEH